MTEINTIARDLAEEAVSALKEARRSRCRFAYQRVNMAGEVSWAEFEFDELPMLTDALDVFRLGASLWRLPVRQQHAVMRALQAQGSLEGLEAKLQFLPRDGDPAELMRLTSAVADHRRQLDDAKQSLQALGKRWIQDLPRQLRAWTWLERPMAIQIMPTGSAASLLEASVWLESLGASMYQPIPLDTSAPQKDVKRWERLWKRYEDCGNAFSLLAVWLRCLGRTAAGGRCQVCYRHLAEGQRRFCTVHVRTAKKRQSSRDLHIGKLKGQVFDALIVARPEINTLVNYNALRRFDASEMLRHSAEDGVHKDLGHAAATLATFLRNLWPVLEPVLHDRIARHFAKVLKVAGEPFRQEPPFPSITAADENARKRNWAKKWLGWEAFFRTWFGPPGLDGIEPDKGVVEAIDEHHPILKFDGEKVAPNDIAMDLAHLWSWVLVESKFDRFAYLDVKAITEARWPKKKSVGKPVSAAKLAKPYVASRQAVRMALIRASNPNAMKAMRKRVLKKGLERLEAML